MIETEFKQFLIDSKKKPKSTYVILNNVFDNSKINLQELHQYLKTKGKPIFQQKDNLNDSKRLQLNLNNGNLRKKEFIGINCILDSVKELFKNNICNETFNFKSSGLYSKNGCQKQRDHSDNPIDNKSIKISNRNFIVLISLENNTKLYVYSNETKKMELVILQQCQILIGRGSLLHAGSDYDVDNIRFHMYVDCADNLRPLNTTYYNDIFTKRSTPSFYYIQLASNNLTKNKLISLKKKEMKYNLLKKLRESK